MPGVSMREFLPERFAEALDGEFRGLISAQTGIREVPSDARDLQNASRVLFAHHGDDGARRVDHAPKVRVDLTLEFGGRHLFERADESVAGIVHEHVDPAERRKRRGNGRVGRGRVGDVVADR